MNKSKAFYLLAVLTVSDLLLCTVPADAVSNEVQRDMDRGQVAIEMAKTPADLEDAIKEFVWKRGTSKMRKIGAFLRETGPTMP